ncbi:MAG: DUF4169 family protein [bacterium]
MNDTNIINLRRARKHRARQEAEQKAAQNRKKYGRTKAQKQLEAAEFRKIQKILDGKKLDPPKG